MFDRREILIATQSLLACTSALLVVGARLAHTPLWYIFAVAICAAAIQVVDNPTRRAAIPAGVADRFTAVIRNTILQLIIPDRLRGRLSSAPMMVTNGGPRLGDAEAGAVAALTNIQFSVVFGGLLTLIGCAILGFAIPASWNWDAKEAIQYAD